MVEKKEPSMLVVSNAPHIKTTDSVSTVMWTVVLALLPAAIYSIYTFRIYSMVVMLASIVAAVAAEYVCQKLFKRPVTVLDGSAVLTGLLVAMNVPPKCPVFIPVIGSFVAIIIVKQLFGGLGFNIFNPALAARAFMMASWGTAMTTTWHTFSGSNVLSGAVANTIGMNNAAFDVITQATPLGVLKHGPKIVSKFGMQLEQFYDVLFSPGMLKSMFFGNIGGVIGETSALFLIIGGLVLLVRKVITWHIPITYIATVALLAAIYYSGSDKMVYFVVFHLLSGGLLLGAFFMATDMVTSPVSAKGMVLFGIGCGLITFIIRIWGGYPEGVSYSILLMNACVPLIDKVTKPKVFGTKK